MKNDQPTKITARFLQKKYFSSGLIKKYLDFCIIIFSALLGLYLGWGILDILMFLFTVWVILNPVSSKFLARVTLLILLFIPILLAIHVYDRADQFTVLAYNFMVLTIIMMIIELKTE